MNKYLILLFVLFVIAYAYMMMEPDKNTLENKYNYPILVPIYQPNCQTSAYYTPIIESTNELSSTRVSNTTTNLLNSKNTESNPAHNYAGHDYTKHDYTNLDSYNPVIKKDDYYTTQYEILDKNLK